MFAVKFVFIWKVSEVFDGFVNPGDVISIIVSVVEFIQSEHPSSLSHICVLNVQLSPKSRLLLAKFQKMTSPFSFSESLPPGPKMALFLLKCQIAIQNIGNKIWEISLISIFLLQNR